MSSDRSPLRFGVIAGRGIRWGSRISRPARKNEGGARFRRQF
jgi:hypothetical protein